MDVIVAKSAWQTIVAELDRVAPREGVLLPLVALEARTANPCTTIGLSALETIVLAEARCLPPQLQEQSAVHVEALPTSDAWADDVVQSLVRRSPRLRAAAYLHSHPFAYEHTSPSRGDIIGHMRPLLARNSEAGLAASFSFIACTSLRAGTRWRLPCFAMDSRERIVELGNSVVVSDDDPRVVRARRARSPRSRLRRWKRRLRRHGFVLTVDELFGGWIRVKVALAGTHTLVVLFPLEFPDAPPQYHLVDTRAHVASVLPLEFSVEAAEVLALARKEAA